jgi:hypothetical protein
MVITQRNEHFVAVVDIFVVVMPVVQIFSE